ncbi:MAG TPA: rhomboid family intramembrane serine protease [Gemmatimonadales bacterium]|nr:rhomboid family intramembrane serine protease [Gemmatimonadales bacterium]
MITKWVGLLIIANILVYMLTAQNPEIKSALEFVPAFLVQRPWTLFTYMFAHDGFGHIFFNMLTLFFFGPRVEDRLGGGRFLTLYFFSGLFGAATWMAIDPIVRVLPNIGLVGASAAVYGVLLAFARLWPRAQLLIWGIVPVQARTMVVILTAMSLFMGTAGIGNVAHFAHLGGFVGGWLCLRIFGTRTVDDRLRPVQPARSPTPAPGAAQRWKQIRLEQLHPVNREEAERVLAKLETRGPNSLTADEQAFLDRFSAM